MTEQVKWTPPTYSCYRPSLHGKMVAPPPPTWKDIARSALKEIGMALLFATAYTGMVMGPIIAISALR